MIKYLPINLAKFVRCWEMRLLHFLAKQADFKEDIHINFQSICVFLQGCISIDLFFVEVQGWYLEL